MAQNLVIPNKDNEVVFIFAGVNLSIATEIKVQFGSESYSSVTNSDIVDVASATELRLNLSSTSEKGRVFATVTYFDTGSVNGFDITSQELGNSGQIIVAIGSQLIIEDGSIVANANSLATDAEFKSWASIRGKQVPSTEPERDALQIAAMMHITGKEYNLSGCRISKIQSLPYPRKGLCVNGFHVDHDEIPVNAKQAQLELALIAYETDLFKNGSSKNVQSQNLKGLSVSYFNNGSTAKILTGSADVYLKPLMINNGSNNIMSRV